MRRATAKTSRRNDVALNLHDSLFNIFHGRSAPILGSHFIGRNCAEAPGAGRANPLYRPDRNFTPVRIHRLQVRNTISKSWGGVRRSGRRPLCAAVTPAQFKTQSGINGSAMFRRCIRADANDVPDLNTPPESGLIYHVALPYLSVAEPTRDACLYDQGSRSVEHAELKASSLLLPTETDNFLKSPRFGRTAQIGQRQISNRLRREVVSILRSSRWGHSYRVSSPTISLGSTTRNVVPTPY
jgi:hypothetical protein